MHLLGHWEVCCLQESTSTCKNDCLLKGVMLKMRRLLNYKRILTFVVTCIMTTSVLSSSLDIYDNKSIEAKTIAELQEQKIKEKRRKYESRRNYQKP